METPNTQYTQRGRHNSSAVRWKVTFVLTFLSDFIKGMCVDSIKPQIDHHNKCGTLFKLQSASKSVITENYQVRGCRSSDLGLSSNLSGRFPPLRELFRHSHSSGFMLVKANLRTSCGSARAAPIGVWLRHPEEKPRLSAVTTSHSGMQRSALAWLRPVACATPVSLS